MLHQTLGNAGNALKCKIERFFDYIMTDLYENNTLYSKDVNFKKIKHPNTALNIVSIVLSNVLFCSYTKHNTVTQIIDSAFFIGELTDPSYKNTNK